MLSIGRHMLTFDACVKNSDARVKNFDAAQPRGTNVKTLILTRALCDLCGSAGKRVANSSETIRTQVVVM